MAPSVTIMTVFVVVGLTREAQLLMPGLADALTRTDPALALLLWQIGQADVDTGLALPAPPTPPALQRGMDLGWIERVVAQ